MTEQESLIEYPCDFPIKIMGKSQPGFAQTILEVVTKHDPGFVAALFQVIIIDLTLAGDNAVVIGLAAAGLPKSQRGRAIFTVDESDRTRLSLTDRDGATSADLTVTPGQSAALSVGRAGAQAQLAAVGETGQLSVAARGQRGWLVAAPTGCVWLS